MMMLRKISAILLLGGIMAAAGAQTLDTEGASPSANDARPTRGMTADSVEAKFGAPVARDAAVGDPPISRWDYPDFVVFFEYDRVIHAVVKRD